VIKVLKSTSVDAKSSSLVVDLETSSSSCFHKYIFADRINLKKKTIFCLIRRMEKSAVVVMWWQRRTVVQIPARSLDYSTHLIGLFFGERHKRFACLLFKLLQATVNLEALTGGSGIRVVLGRSLTYFRFNYLFTYFRFNFPTLFDCFIRNGGSHFDRPLKFQFGSAYHDFEWWLCSAADTCHTLTSRTRLARERPPTSSTSRRTWTRWRSSLEVATSGSTAQGRSVSFRPKLRQERLACCGPVFLEVIT